MAYQTISVTAAWPDTPHYIAAGATDLEIINPFASWMHFITTDDDMQPALATTQGSPIAPGSSRAMTLRDGERLWCAVNGGTATWSATLQY